MKYVKIGFWLSVGWFVGETICEVTDDVLTKKFIKSETYQKLCRRLNIKPTVVHEEPVKRKVVVGFVRETES